MPNTFSQWHDYEIDWTPEKISWSVDGQLARTVLKKDTYNSTRKDYDFPQTPSRIQLSIWPGGLASNAKGTIEWAGGEVTWSGPDINAVGYYYALVKEVEVQCYDPPSYVKKSGSKSYIYTDDAGMDRHIEITNKNTVLKSILGTGTDTEKEPEKTDKDSKTTSTVRAVPGLDGIDLEELLPNRDGADPAGGNGDVEGDDVPISTDFFQNGGAGDNNPGAGGNGGSGSAPQGGEATVRGSIFAVVIALLATTML